MKDNPDRKDAGSHPLLDLRNLSLVLNGRVILDSVSLCIGPRENVAILGPNGSGKSSLIKLITREYYPLDLPGVHFRIFNQDKWDLFELRSLLGIVSDDLERQCTREFSGREIVLSGFFGSIGLSFNHRVTAEMEEKTEEVLRFLEAAALAEKKLTEMSSGEVRRILIGRALVHDPQALVLDEPTSSLDFHLADAFREVIRKIARSGKGVVMVTHNLRDIIPEIKRVVLLKKGRVFKDGEKDRVMTEENLSELFETKVGIVRRNGYYQVW